MKKLIFALSLVVTGIMSAQSVDILFIPEGVQTTTQSTAQIITDPFNSTTSTVSTQKPVVSSSTEVSSFSAGAETEVSKYAKSITLPLAYSWKNYSASLSVPYFIERSMKYSVGDKKTSGIGDVSVGAGYFNTIDALDSLGYQLNLLVKLPTGDDKKMADGYLVPLGTGTVDHSLGLTLTRKYGDYFFRFKTATRINSIAKKSTEIVYANQGVETINYDIKNGNSVKMSFGCDYSIWSRLDLLTALDLSVYADGTTDLSRTYSWNRPAVSQTGMANKQELTMMDFNLGASYNLAIWEVGAYLSIPVYTKRETDNNEEDRAVSFRLKFDYKFF